jgi:hypothetical protein
MMIMFMAGRTDDAANIAAINTYVMTQPINTSAAGKVRDKWLKYHDNLSWVEKNLPSLQDYDQARNILHEFDLANAKTSEEKADVKSRQQTGVTSEEMRGETKRTQADGNYLPPPPEKSFAKSIGLSGSNAWLPTKTKIALALGGIVFIAGSIAKKIYLDPLLPKRR